MIQPIDFLPASYHQKRQAQQKTLWRRGVFVVFVALIAAGAFGQWQSRLRLQTTRDGGFHFWCLYPTAARINSDV